VIRVTVEIWPSGDPTRSEVLGVMNIINDLSHPERPAYGNYRIEAEDGPKKWTTKVLGFPRHLGWFSLLNDAVRAAHVTKFVNDLDNKENE